MNGMMTPMSALLMDSIRQQVRTGQPVWGERESSVPVQRYFSSDQWQAEMASLFRHYPLILAHASELMPGQVLANDDYGLPLLLTRDDNGRVHCFLNVCRHRGMRLVQSGPPEARKSLVCAYHGWTYQLDGALRHILHADAFDACAEGARDLVALPCEERHGLIWVLPDAARQLDLDAYLGPLNEELAWFELDQHVVYRSVQAEYAANWKLIVDAFLEPYHIRVLDRDTIYPFFTDGITAAQRIGPHIHSLVARRTVQEPHETPQTHEALRRLVTPSQVLFPNTITIFHPDYLSLISLCPSGPETLRWTHRMLIPKAKATPDWSAHWEKTFRLIEQGVFQKEDLFAAVNIQRGLRSGANQALTIGRIEQAVGWFHEQVQAAVENA
jgi:phenylpropionate dioxygenase-like ring-hydroxylating dioxygenase large terminal subunit